MSPWLIISIGMMLFAWGPFLYNYATRPKAIKSKYDPHYTRQLETEVYGFTKTFCKDEKCSECYPASRPLPPKGPGAASTKRSKKVYCQACHVATYHPSGYCLPCLRDMGETSRRRVLGNYVATAQKPQLTPNPKPQPPKGPAAVSTAKKNFQPLTLERLLELRKICSEDGEVIDIMTDESVTPVKTIPNRKYRK